MKKPIILIIVTLLLSLAFNNLYAGAWTQKKNSGFYKLGIRYISSSKIYNQSGTIIEGPKFSNLFISLYGEYGINEYITLIANLSALEKITVNDYTNNKFSQEGYSNKSISDSEFGLRYKFWNGDGSILSTELIIGLPIGDIDNKYGLYTGDGESNQIINILFGQSFYPLPLYISTQFGFNNRNEGFSDELRYAAEIGFNFIPSMLIALKIHGVQTLENGDEFVKGGSFGFHTNNQKYLAFGPELSYSITKSFGLSLGFESATNAANVPSALAYSFGIYFKN